MDTLWQDFRYAFRMLAKSPGFTAVALLTLGLGIGANTAIFSVVNGLFLHPAGVPDPDHLEAIRVKYEKLNLASIGVSGTDFADVRDSKQVFSSAALEQDASYNYAAGDQPQRLEGAKVSWQWFDVFQAKPILGRVFRPEEDQPNTAPVAVLAYDAWKNLFAGDGTIVGKEIQLNSQPYKIVGVMGPNFHWPNQAKLWVPIGLPASEFAPASRYNESYFGVARVRPEVSPAQAKSYVELLSRRHIEHDSTKTYARDSGWGMFVIPLTEFVFGDLKSPMLVLLGAVGFVLLIACSNIAGLMLARSSARSRELAVRAALGASRWRLIRQALAESLLLAGGGTILGLLLALGGIRGLLFFAPENLAQGLIIRPDAYVLLFTILIGLFAGILFGIAPAWQVSSMQQFEQLKEGGRTGTASPGRQRLRAVLVASEIALALILLVGAGLLLKSLSNLQGVSPGFDARGVMTAAISLPDTRYKEEPQQIAFYQAVAQRLANQPGVSSAAVATPIPFTGMVPSSSFSIENRPEGPGDPGPHSDLQWVTPGYFQTLGIPLRAGRLFTDEDRVGAQPVVIIDENLARQYWANQNPIGQRLNRGGPPWKTIVGVVGHVFPSALVGDTGKGVCYYPAYQQPIYLAFLVAKTTMNPASLAGAIREAVQSVDSGQPIYDLKTMEERVGESLGPRRFGVTMVGFFAGVALLMAAMGLFGIISYSVTQRTQEIGVRIALGAQRSDVLKLILGQGLRLALVGVGIGLIGSLALTRVLSSLLYGVSATDPVTFAAVAMLLAMVALLACYLPARRAMRVDPIVALRYE
jgi:predicted permease